ncbi:MAG: PD-(D/E)XK nuclease family protein, partial [Rhizobiales bacterium]|nr:PD-(D/E)XK nuclease family protein [Hyphomicrobiales bacterium]
RVAPRLLRPSSAGGETHPRPARARLRAAGEPDALKRGTLMHRLLEALPDVPAARRADAARAYLGRVKPPVGDEIAERIIAEVPIVGRIAATDGRPLVVSGQVDRLAVGDAVLIGDFKTDRAVPRDAAAVPAGYVAQLSVYRAVLSRLYPNRPVRAAILFTAAPRLIELPQELLDETLAAILAGRLDPPDPHT